MVFKLYRLNENDHRPPFENIIHEYVTFLVYLANNQTMIQMVNLSQHLVNLISQLFTLKVYDTIFSQLVVNNLSALVEL